MAIVGEKLAASKKYHAKMIIHSIYRKNRYEASLSTRTPHCAKKTTT